MSKSKLAAIIVICTVAIIIAIVLSAVKPWEETPSADTYTLTTSVSPSGAGSVSPSGGEYESSDQVTLTVSPASGYTFDHWSGDASDSSPTIVITMDSDKDVIAYFETISSSDCMCYSYTLKRYIPCDQATAICRDGTCSISQTRSGTCSWHGGVARWID